MASTRYRSRVDSRSRACRCRTRWEMGNELWSGSSTFRSPTGFGYFFVLVFFTTAFSRFLSQPFTQAVLYPRVFFPIVLPGPCQSRKVDAQSWWGPTRKMRSTKCFSAPWFLTSRRPFLVRSEDVSIRLVRAVVTLNGHDPAGARWYIRWQKELMLAADVAYFGLTTFCGECAVVMHVMPHPNTLNTRCVVEKNRGWDVVKGEVRTINDRNICERRCCMKNNGKSPTFKFVPGEERRPSKVQRVSRGWRLPGATHLSEDLTWIRKWLDIQAPEPSELESLELELGSCCSDLDKQVSDEICRIRKRQFEIPFCL